MNTCVVDVTKLTAPCITRNRGREAAIKLSSCLNNCIIELDLRNAELVSLSFLDELICQHQVLVNKGEIKFITDDKYTENKLSRISAVRSITIYCHDSHHIEYIVPAEHYTAPIPTFSTSKG